MPINAKKCSAEDLELNEQEAIDLFALWANSTLICPDWDPDLKTLIKGDTSSILTRNLVFEVEKCMDDSRTVPFTPCGSGGAPPQNGGFNQGCCNSYGGIS